MKAAAAIPLSVLDLAPVKAGGTVADSLRETLDLARHAERLGFTRFWLAEHHNMTGIASAATAVLIGHVAGGTRSIRVGSGGVMLPNHSPLVAAVHPARGVVEDGDDALRVARDDGVLDVLEQRVEECLLLLGRQARPFVD